MEDYVECVQLTKGEVQYIHLVFQICLVQLCMEGISINKKQQQQQGTKKMPRQVFLPPKIYVCELKNCRILISAEV